AGRRGRLPRSRPRVGDGRLPEPARLAAPRRHRRPGGAGADRRLGAHALLPGDQQRPRALSRPAALGRRALRVRRRPAPLRRAAGIAPELTALAEEIWAEPGPTMAKFPELERRAAGLGATPPQIGNLKMIFTMHGKMAPERWADFFPHVVHVHGKFYGIVEG